MSASPHANGGLVTEDLDIPPVSDYALAVERPGSVRAESTRPLGALLRDIYTANPDSFRLFCPDETNSNRLGAVFEVSDRCWAERVTDGDVKISRNGRVMEVLSEHNCHGWLEGYTLTGRHGMFATYEAFAMVSASQTIQHFKWLEEAAHLAVACACAQSQHPAHLDRVAQRPQRLLAPGARADPERDQPARRGRPGLPAAGRQLPPVRGRPRPQVTLLREPDRHRQAASATVADARAGRGTLPARSRDLGMGRQRRRTCRPGPRARVRGRRRDHGDGRCGPDPARTPASAARPRRQRGRPVVLGAPQGPSSRSGRDNVPRALHRQHRRRLLVPRLPRRRAPAPARSASRPTGSTCVASSKRARPRRPSTWWSATRSPGSTW